MFPQGCPAQFGTWDGGAQYGGVANREQCSKLPPVYHDACHFRWDFLEGADNPKVSFREVTCPVELTRITGCIRHSSY
ncbi:hypothetical protein MPER_08094 [Moniliophthora perniciosa FA553]|nr:hypothetical protein MPER_08094 [Moniliophthora perniciosa FA553]